MQKIIERFDKYMKNKGLNDNKVTNQLQLSVGVLGKSRKEGRDLSKNIVEKILNYYTDLSSTWLLTGEGQMLNNETAINNTQEMNNEIIKLLKKQNEDLINQLADKKEYIQFLMRQIEVLETKLPSTKKDEIKKKENV